MNINSKCITLASGGKKKEIFEFLENDYVEVPDSLLYPKGIMHFSKRNQQTTWNILTLYFSFSSCKIRKIRRSVCPPANISSGFSNENQGMV